MKKYFDEICFYYDILNVDQKSNVIRYNSWSDRMILIYLVINSLKFIFYILWNEQDQLVRLYGGNMEIFFGSNTLYFSIPEAGVILYIISSFCLFHYSPLNQLNWLNVFNPIEGKETFVKRKMFMVKSAKNLIRFSLILIILFSIINHITPIYSGFYFMYIPFKNITFEQFIFYAIPWALNNTLWIMFACYYFFASLLILIICYYYQLRLNQLDVYVNLYLKYKKFKTVDQQVVKVLIEYANLINEMNQLNKFVSKMVFFVLLFCSTTVAFLVYNMIYVKIDWIVYTLYILFAANVGFVILMMMLGTIRIGDKFKSNKNNLIKLNYVENLKIKTRIKVSCYSNCK